MRKILITLFFSVHLHAHEFTPCDENGMADIYPCMDIDLMHRMHIDHMGGQAGDTGSDIWGWTDPDTGKEYAITTLSYGTTFVDISHPAEPVYLGKLETNSVNSLWRDVKTHNNFAYIVSEASGHGMQIFDLTRLRNLKDIPVDFTADAIYNEFGRAHNIVVNETTGFAYAVGTRQGNQPCAQGLHMIDLSNPTSPTFAGCFDQDGYTHDAQCVTYIGPDTEHMGKEICFNSNTDTLTIVDVSNKSDPIQLSRTGYANSQYTHQGWLTENQRYFLMNDELDEQRLGHKTKTYIWDLVNLDSPQLIGFYSGPKQSADHNLYVKGNHAYLTNYSSGLSIVEISDIGNANLTEVANFDSFPSNDNSAFSGAWSNYPFFESGIVIMSDLSGGLFILDPNLCPTIAATTGLSGQANGNNSINLSWNDDLNPGDSYNVYRSEGGCDVDNFSLIAQSISNSSFIDNTVSGQVTVGYQISKTTPDACESNRSTCIETTTPGTCTAAPIFTGIASVTSSNANQCGLDIGWNAASSQCGNALNYDIYRSTDPSFTPDASNLVASSVQGAQWHDASVLPETEYYYLVRVRDEGNLSVDANVVKLANIATGPVKNGTWSAGAEIGDSGFNQETRHVGWEVSEARANTGNRSYWSQSQSNTCNDLTSESIQLTPGENSQLSFWTAHDIESRWDGGVVEITNNDTKWNPVSLSPDYPGTFRDTNDGCNYAENTPSFTGTDLTWTQHTVDLSSFQGQSIKLRWNYSSDGAQNQEGWFLDDINVTNTQIPAQCQAQSDFIFSSGFE